MKERAELEHPPGNVTVKVKLSPMLEKLLPTYLHSFEHKHIVRACVYSEDTHLLLTDGVEKILRIYDLNRPDAPPREVDKSPCSVRIVGFIVTRQY